jgi:hypothetical protein
LLLQDVPGLKCLRRTIEMRLIILYVDSCANELVGGTLV